MSTTTSLPSNEIRRYHRSCHTIHVAHPDGNRCMLTPHVAPNHAFSVCAAPNMNNDNESQMFLCPSQQRWPRVVVRHRSDSLEIEVISTSARVVLQFALAHGVFPAHHISTLNPHFTSLSHWQQPSLVTTLAHHPAHIPELRTMISVSSTRTRLPS